MKYEDNPLRDVKVEIPSKQDFDSARLTHFLLYGNIDNYKPYQKNLLNNNRIQTNGTNF